MYEIHDPWWTRTLCWNHPSDSPVSRYALVGRQSSREIPLEGAFWADWDQKGRLVFTRQGKVFAGGFDGQGQVVPRELADFNADRFEPREAPAWAREW